MVDEMSRVCSMYGGEVHTGFWQGNRMENIHGIPRCLWEDNFKRVLKEIGWRTWTGYSWLRIGKSSGQL